MSVDAGGGMERGDCKTLGIAWVPARFKRGTVVLCGVVDVVCAVGDLPVGSGIFFAISRLPPPAPPFPRADHVLHPFCFARNPKLN